MYLMSSPLIKKESHPENDSRRLRKKVWNGLFLDGNPCDLENKVMLYINCGNYQKVTSLVLAQPSGENVLDDMSFFVHPGQAEVESLVLVSEALRPDAELVKHGCVKVANMNHVFLSIVAEFVGISVGFPAFDSSARHPD